MGDTVAGGRYRVRWRDGQWVVRAPDGRTVQTFGVTDDGHAQAAVWANRANEKLRTVDRR